jgi:hypothetical protein
MHMICPDRKLLSADLDNNPSVSFQTLRGVGHAHLIDQKAQCLQSTLPLRALKIRFVT